MWKIRELTDKVTNVVMNYTEVEAKVREATNDDAWGPTGALMQEVAQCTFTYEHFPEVMGMLWKRMLHDNKKNCRRTYKALLLLGYLVRNGSERVVTSAREHIYDLRSLENYTFIDEHGKDQGVNVRQRVKDLIDFIQDDDKLREERKKAKKTKDKYVGMSSDSLSFKYGDQFESRSKKWKDTFEEWDPDQRGSIGRRKSFDDVSKISNDETEKSESDRDQNSAAEYHDSDSRESPDHPRINKQRSPTRSGRKIDLGAAALYGKENKNASSLETSPSKPQSGSSGGQDLLSDLVDLAAPSASTVTATSATTPAVEDDDFNPRAPSVEHQNATNGDFGDFAAFNKSPPAQKGQDDFADFTAFVSPAAPNPQPSPSVPPPTYQEVMSSLQQPSFQPLLMSAAPGMPVMQQVPFVPVAVPNSLPPPGMQPGAVPQPLITAGLPFGMQGYSSRPMLQPSVMLTASVSSPCAFDNLSGHTAPTLTPMTSSQKQNTWSNSGSVDISLDNLSLGPKLDKPNPPSMNELASFNVGVPQQMVVGPAHYGQYGTAMSVGMPQHMSPLYSGPSPSFMHSK